MKAFFRKLAIQFSSFMSGRNGFDNLGIAILCGSLLLQFLALSTGIFAFLLLSYVLYAWMLFRIFSKNKAKRSNENVKFISWYENTGTRIRQFCNRVRWMRKYKYFKCPYCKTLLRLNRGCGEKSICCPKCGRRFHAKA